MMGQIAFCGRLTEYLDEVRAVDLIFLSFSKIFNSVSNSILLSGFGHYRLLEN